MHSLREYIKNFLYWSNRGKFIFIIFFLSIVACASTNQKISYDSWKLEWEENFNVPILDTLIWSKIPRGSIAWNNKMTDSERCYEFRDSTLVLKGIANDFCPEDTAQYLTGGIWTKNKKGFPPGRLVIRAKLRGTIGAWPAIWLGVVNKTKPWPWYGEIDIMEGSHKKSTIHQTLHSYYTISLHHKEPSNSVKVPIDKNDFNVYGVDILKDKIVFHVNGEETMVYPQLPEHEEEGQFPFFQDWYLIIDMQFKSKKEGPIKREELPAEMEIDWIKHYVYNNQ